jgi:4-alpha-glucanotransferase
MGAQRRAGVLAPLFSIYSEKSSGIGEFPDIKPLVDWCVKCGMSIIQLLPLNDSGFDFAPYSAQSTFALDPMYLRLESVEGAASKEFERDMAHLKGSCPAGAKRVDYRLKKIKLKTLRKIFSSFKATPGFEKFCADNGFWLSDYAVFKVLKENNSQRSWEDWEEKYKFVDKAALREFERDNADEINFQKWLQYQIYLQFSQARQYANSKGVFLQGDLPFLVARDSSDVWANQDYFNLDVSSGAPPDMYFAKGQRWGMPTYNWDNIEKNGHDYLKEKIKFAENFYDMFRIDHFVGLFRLWTINLGEPSDAYGLKGKFDPEDEGKWKEHGQKILSAMMEKTLMLPCAEDLGVVPACSYETLREFAIPGMDVQRWARDWSNTYDFKDPDKYRENSTAVISSHDMSPLAMWWEQEASTVDAMLVDKYCVEHGFSRENVIAGLFDTPASTGTRLRWLPGVNSPEEVLRRLGKSRDQAWMFYDMHRESYNEKAQFWKYLGLPGEPATKADSVFIAAALKKAASSRSVFSIQLIQDWLSLGSFFDRWDRADMRTNTPGSITDNNWSITMPLPLEAMLSMSINKEILGINRDSGRI